MWHDMRDIVAAWGNLLKRGADSAAILDQISKKNPIQKSNFSLQAYAWYAVRLYTFVSLRLLFTEFSRSGMWHVDGKTGGHVWEVCDDFADAGFLPCAYRERSRRCTYSSAARGDLLFHATILRVSHRKEFRLARLPRSRWSHVRKVTWGIG